MRRVLPTTSVAVLTLSLAAGTAHAGETCISDWSIAAPIVKSQSLVPVEELQRAAREKFGGDIVKTTLCEVNGTYVYRLVVKGAGGQVRSQTVDAHNPFGG